MISKLLPVGLMVCGIGLATQSAYAQSSGGNSGCQSNAPSGPEPKDWHGPSSYQPGPDQRPMTAPPAPQAPRQAPGQTMNQQPAQGAMTYQQAPAQQGQMAQSNNQSYQSFSAEPQAAPTYSYAPNTSYSYPTYGYGYGYGGPYYGGSFNGGSYYGGNGSYGNTTGSRWDNAGNHGINANAYP
jgi:hypothetical protein